MDELPLLPVRPDDRPTRDPGGPVVARAVGEEVEPARLRAGQVLPRERVRVVCVLPGRQLEAELVDPVSCPVLFRAQLRTGLLAGPLLGRPLRRRGAVAAATALERRLAVVGVIWFEPRWGGGTY